LTPTSAGYDNLRIGEVTAVPEPAMAWLWLSGLVAVAGLARRRRG
jgi:MYXO-CTERM domain-containing protein